MGHVFRLLSSSGISYISITCGSFVIYKALCARQKRKEFESTLSVSSHAASAVARSVPFTSSTAEDGTIDRFVRLTAPDFAPLRGALLRSYSSIACVVPDFPSESVLHISRDVWRETLASAKAAAKAAGIPERELDPRQLAAAISAAYVFTTTQGNSCALFGTGGFDQPSSLLKKCSSFFPVVPYVQHLLRHAATLRWPWVNDTPVTCVSKESHSTDRQTNPCVQPVEGPGDSTARPSPTADPTESRAEDKNSPPCHDTPAVVDGSGCSDFSRPSKSSNVLQCQQLCVGRVAAVQEVRRQLRIVRARDGASQTFGEGEPHRHCSTRPYIQWPGKYLRVTYQYFVVSPDKGSDMTGRTHESHTETHDDTTRKTHRTLNREKTENGKLGNSRAAATLISQQEGYGRHVGLSIMKQATRDDKKGSRDSFPAWGHLLPQGLRNAFDTLTQRLLFFRSGNDSMTRQTDASMHEWMPPLSICERTVEFRLPTEGYTEKHRRKAVKEMPPTVSKYGVSRDSDVSTAVQATATEAPARAGEVLGATPEKRKSAPDVRPTAWMAKETEESQVAPPAASSVARGCAFSGDSHKHQLAPGLKSAASGGCQRGEGADDGIDTCENSVAVKPLRCVRQAWRDIQPQQLIVVSYETGKPYHSTPLIVLTQPGETTLSNRSATVRNSAGDGSSAANDAAVRAGTVENSQIGGGAVLLNSKGMINASTRAVEDNNYRLCGRQQDSPYSGELIEVAGNAVQSDEKVLFTAGGLLTSLGILKLCLQKLLLRRVRM